MFIRQCYRKKNGRRHAYWAVVESYRTERGPRQRIVAWLGVLDEAGRLGIQQTARHDATARRDDDIQLPLFEYEDEPVEPRWMEVDTAKVRVERIRQFGGPWLAMQLIDRLQLDRFLNAQLPPGREHIQWSLSALILVIARLLNPSSGLHIAEQWYGKTALPELLGVPAERVDDNRLYRTLDALLPHKEALEIHLKNRLGELFALDYDVAEIVGKMEQRYGKSDRIWVLDRGMVSESNLAFLRDGERRYIVGTPKSMLKTRATDTQR